MLFRNLVHLRYVCLAFFQDLGKTCTSIRYEPVIVITKKNGIVSDLYAEESLTIKSLFIFIDCGIFPSLQNGFVTYSLNTTFGSRVFLKCDEGFYLTGNIYSDCNSSGIWSYTDQTCDLIGKR